MRRRFMFSQQLDEDKKSYWVIFDESQSTTVLERGGNEKVRDTIRAKFKRCMAMPQANGKAAIAYLNENDSTKWPDGSTVAEISTNRDGKYIMVHFPKYYYRNEDLGSGKNKLYISEEKLNDNYKEERECLIGVFETSYVTDGAVRCGSFANTGSASNENITSFYTRSQNNGSQWGLIDYRAHKTIANMFCIMYGSTDICTANSSIPCSGGTRPYNINVGGTLSLGNADGKEMAYANTSYYSSSFLGLEDCYYGKWEFVQGINIVADRQWVVYDGGLLVDKTAEELIAEGFTNVRTIGTAPGSDAWITKIKHGEYADIMPVATGAGSDTTYYTDYYFTNNGNRILLRSGVSGYSSRCGVFMVGAGYLSSDYASVIGSRLGFYGTIEVKTKDEWLALTPDYTG